MNDDEPLQAWFGRDLAEVIKVGYLFAFRITRGHKADAEDLVVETLTGFFEKLVKGLLPMPDDPIRYFLTAILHKYIDALRAQGRHPIVSMSDLDLDRFLDERSEFSTSSDELEILKIVLNLPEKIREVVIYRLYGGLTYSQIAEKQQVSQSTVRNRLQKARELLAAANNFDEQGEG